MYIHIYIYMCILVCLFFWPVVKLVDMLLANTVFLETKKATFYMDTLSYEINKCYQTFILYLLLLYKCSVL